MSLNNPSHPKTYREVVIYCAGRTRGCHNLGKLQKYITQYCEGGLEAIWTQLQQHGMDSISKLVEQEEIHPDDVYYHLPRIVKRLKKTASDRKLIAQIEADRHRAPVKA